MDNQLEDKLVVGQLVLANDPFHDNRYWPATVEAINVVEGGLEKITVQFFLFSKRISTLEKDQIQEYEETRVWALQRQYNSKAYNEAISHAESYRKETEPKSDLEAKPSRCAQPCVFVNVESYKVKMEIDYNPIIAPKEEDEEGQNVFDIDDQNKRKNVQIGHDKNKAARGDKSLDVHSSKASCQVEMMDLETKLQSALNSKDEIKLNCNEIHQLLNIIKFSREKSEGSKTQQQEKEEVEMEMESNASDTDEMEEIKEETETISDQENDVFNTDEMESTEETDAESKAPLEDKKVLSRIFNYLDIKSLKTSRFVCRQWRNEAGKILLKNFYLICDDEERCENALINLRKISSSCSFPASKAPPLKLWSKNGQVTLKFLETFHDLIYSVQELKFSDKLLNTEDLYEILNVLPNLKVLETSSLVLDLRPRRVTRSKLRNNAPIDFKLVSPEFKLDQLVQKLQTLKELKLEFCLHDTIAPDFLDHRQQFASIKSMEIYVESMDFMSRFIESSLYNWRITRFTLDVHRPYNADLIRSFLLQISPSLQHLRFELFMSEDFSVLETWTDNWIIPLGLKRLETLEIQYAFRWTYNLQFIVNSILAALQLPRLKRLTLPCFPFDREWKNDVDKWNSHESAYGRTLSSKSLEELEVVFNSSRLPLKIPGNFWPGLKSFKYSWKAPETFNASVLSELPNLERLELIFSLGSYTVKSKKEETNDNQSSSEFQLQILKNLRSFSLRVPRNDQEYQKFANHLVQTELKFMKSLQFVEFQGVSIDAEPLKSALGPRVAIIFTE